MAEEERERELGLFYGVIAGLGSTLGIEFFVLLDHATLLAGPGVVMSLVLSGLLNLLIMFNYAELSSSVSRVGAEYTFTKAAFGGFICFLSGWLRWLTSIFTTTLSAIGFAQVIRLLLPQVNTSLVAVAVIVVFTVIRIRGGRRVDIATVVSFIVVFAALCILGTVSGLSFENFYPFTPRGFYPGVLEGAMYTFSMYVGMRAIATQSPMMKEPGKTLPRTILLSTLISIIVYCSVAFVVVGVVPRNTGTLEPLLIHFGKTVMGTLGEVLVAIAWTAAALMSLSFSMEVQISILSALSRDGYLPRIIFSSNERSLTRYIAQTMGAVVAILFAATGLIVFVGYAAGFASLTVFALVNLSLIKLRIDRPTLDRPFKTPLYPYTPVIGIITALALMVFVEGSAVMLVLGFVVLSLIMYHLKMMGYRRLRVAVGGINLGVSGIAALILCLIQTGAIQLPLSPQEQTTIVIFGAVLGVVFFIAGILNLTGRKKEDTAVEELQIGRI